MKKNKLILLQLLIMFVLISTSVYAAVDTKISLSTTEETAFRGDKVEVTLSLKNVEKENKIQSVTGYINYDKNVIEPLTVDSIKQDEGNTVTIGNETLNVEDLTDADVNKISMSSAYVAFNGNPTTGNDSRIVIDFKDGITKDTELLTMEFGVKDDATLGEVEEAISYSMFVTTADSAESAEMTENVSLTVKAVESGNEDENNTDNENDTEENKNKNENKNEEKNENKNTNKNTNKNENKNENKNTNKNTNKNVSNKPNNNTNKNDNNNTDNSVSGATLPAAGVKVIIIPAIILVILAYVSYNRYMKYRDI